MTEFVRFERRGRVGIVTLNRGPALNALNEEMLTAIAGALDRWRDDPHLAAIVLRSAEPRAFCAGGDVRAVHARRGDDAFMERIYAIEYALDLTIHTFPKPVVALVNGITMGGGCGISLHAAHRVATPDLTLAMPETAIGFFPDAGGSFFLGRLPDGIGTYLGLTGFRIGAGDALELGLVDAVVEPDRHGAIVDRLAAGDPPDIAIAAVPKVSGPPRRLERNHSIADCFQQGSALGIRERLEARDDDWAVETARQLRRRAPFSLEVTARLVERAKGLDLRAALAMEFRLARRFMRRDDYFEGVRAVLIDKDHRPAWNPDRLEDVDIAAVEGCFAPLPSRELWP